MTASEISRPSSFLSTSAATPRSGAFNNYRNPSQLPQNVNRTKRCLFGKPDSNETRRLYNESLQQSRQRIISQYGFDTATGQPIRSSLPISTSSSRNSPSRDLDQTNRWIQETLYEALAAAKIFDRSVRQKWQTSVFQKDAAFATEVFHKITPENWILLTVTKHSAANLEFQFGTVLLLIKHVYNPPPPLHHFKQFDGVISKTKQTRLEPRQKNQPPLPDALNTTSKEPSRESPISKNNKQ